jgi:hypothetical protein
VLCYKATTVKPIKGIMGGTDRAMGLGSGVKALCEVGWPLASAKRGASVSCHVGPDRAKV